MTFIDEHIDDTDFFDESKFDTYVPTTDMFRRAPRAYAGRRLCSGARDSRRVPAVPAYRCSPQTLFRRRTPSKFGGTWFRNMKPQLRMFPAVVGAPLLAIL